MMTTRGSSPDTKACAEPATYPDLGACVHRAGVPPGLLDELPECYSSAYCVAEYFEAWDRTTGTGVCTLDDPRHLIVFTVSGRTIDILNKIVDIEPEAAERVATALFRAHPRVDRIRAEVKFEPSRLRRSSRTMLRADDYVVELPDSEEGYLASLGKTTRKHLRQYANQLRRRYPEFTFRVLERDDIPYDILQRVAAWNQERMSAKGIVSRYEHDPDEADRLWHMLPAYGLAMCGYDGSECVAGQLVLGVGRETWVHTVGFDSRYEDVHLGLLMLSFTITESIRRGYKRVHLLWGTSTYKKRLGGVPETAYRVSLYRSRLHKTIYVREQVRWLLVNRTELYWGARQRLRGLRTAASALRDRTQGAAAPKDG